ncbi:MAG TPA: VanW family protein [Candidatus Limnocylindrales bacterium]|nr:VanW family protein [Candidatus Limnocylindrales bacterium]
MTTVQPAPAPPSRKGALALRFAIAFLAGIVLVIAVGGGALYAYGQQYTGKVLPGVRVGDADLSGLSPEQARDRLEEAYGPLGAGTITLAGPDGELTVGYTEIGRRPDIESMLAAALAAGRRGEHVADLLGAPQTALRGVSLTPRVRYDEEKLAAAIASVARTIDRDPVDATLTADKGTFASTSSVDGRTVDQAALRAAIDAKVTPLDAPDEVRVDIPYDTQEPAFETADATTAIATAERMAADLVLARGDRTWTIKGSKLRKLITFSPTADGSFVPVVDRDGIKPLLKPLARDLDRVATNARFKLAGSRVVFARASKEGRKLDRGATQDAILEAMMNRQAGQAEGVVAPVVVAREPTVTTAFAKRIAPRMKRISKWTTYFPIWDRNGFGANIWIPAKIISGYVVGPGETFSFWNVVGEVTRAKGYTDGGAIINGRTEPQGALAGGICSCSTTLFNAALRAGYKMGDRRNHYYYIDRYPKGLDATVFKSGSGSNQDMTWTNDTEYPVLIRGLNTRSGGRGYVTFQLYSVPTGRKVVIGSARVSNVRQATDTRVAVSSKPSGWSERVESPHDGMDVSRTVTVYHKGKVISRRTYVSHYGVVTGVVQYGTGD